MIQDALSPEHLIFAPILIPMITGALMLLYDDRQRRAKLILSLVSAFGLLLVAAELVSRSRGTSLTGGNQVGIYLLGDWPTPMAIVLVLDRLSAMMLLLVAVLAIPALIYSAAGWHRQGQHFHSLFQFLLMGLNGAFLTGDLFNLFVFFEVLLAASYGLLLHGSGQLRVRAGLHYIAINLVASLFFLIGVALIYGITGTLNMAQLATLIADLPEADRPLFHTAAGILGTAFLVKAGIWPLSFWLPTAYMAASAPVAAMFAIMTKVGVYAVMRMSMLVFGVTAGASQGFGSNVLVYGGMATVIFGFLGVLASQGLGRITAHLVLVSSGTVLTVVGFSLQGGGTQLLAGALFYLLSSSVATAALFLLVEPMSREEGGIASMLALTADAYGVNLPEDEPQAEVGLTIPATLTVMGASFIACVLLFAGLPPLSGFIGKFAMLSGILSPSGFGASEIAWQVWAFVALLIFSGFAALIALMRIGIQTFWAAESTPPRALVLEIGPIVGLVAVAVLMSIQAQGIMRYMDATARALQYPVIYVDGVIRAPRVADHADETAETVDTDGAVETDQSDGADQPEASE